MSGWRPRKVPIAVVLLAGLLLGGCASSPPSRFYTLTPLPEAERARAEIDGGGLAVGIGPVVFPQYLDRPQLVVRDGSNRLRVEEFNRWGGTVQDDFLRVWGENLSHLLDTSRVLIFPSESRMPLDFRITAEVVTFAARRGSEVLLKVRWAVMDERLEQAFATREDRYRCPLETAGVEPADDGLGALFSAEAGSDAEPVVAAMSRCVGRFSRDVAEVVRALPKPAPPARDPFGALR
jgi:uncharacterized lipoprotein YmbA